MKEKLEMEIDHRIRRLLSASNISVYVYEKEVFGPMRGHHPKCLEFTLEEVLNAILSHCKLKLVANPKKVTVKAYNE